MSVKPLKLLVSDKTHMLPSQERMLREIYRNAERSLLEKDARELFNIRIQFKPSQDWITQFKDIGFYFFEVLQGPGVAQLPIEFDVRYDGVQPNINLKENFIVADGIPMEWKPKNGEEIEVKINSMWLPGTYIAAHDTLHVVWCSGSYYPVNLAAIRQKPRKTKVTLDELMDVYSKVNLTPVSELEFVNVQ